MSISLNTAQQQAVEHSEGPLLVIAGAGTGKTAVIIERILYLIESGQAQSEEILALTFTEKATGEMMERLDQRLPLGKNNCTVATFHDFCGQILRERGQHIGLPTNFQILDSINQWLLVRENLFKLPLGALRPLANPTALIVDLLSHLSRIKEENVWPDEYEAYAAKIKDEEEKAVATELASAYRWYQELMLAKGYLDFGDLQLYTLKLLAERPQVLTEYQQKYRYILVDEYQDVNYIQALLVDQLAAKHNNLTVVGDDDQAIYRFRGASVSNILAFGDKYPQAQQVVLTENYRSTQTILDTSYQLITNNNPDRLEEKMKIDKKLVAATDETGEVLANQFAQDTDEIEWIADRIKQLVADGISYGQMAVLTRTNATAADILSALRLLGIPVRSSSLRGLYERPEIIDLIALLKVLTDRYDDTALYRLLSADYIGLPALDLQVLLRTHRELHVPLWKLLESIDDSDDISAEGKKIALAGHKFILEYIEYAKKQRASELIKRIVEDTGLYERLDNSEDIADHEKRQNLELFWNIARDFEKVTFDPRTANFTQYLELRKEAGDDPKGAALEGDLDAVTVGTIHSAKGLQWHTVFLPKWAHLAIPSRRQNDKFPVPGELIKEALPEGDTHIPEERRLAYVALTRAERNLYISYAHYYGYGVRAKKPSAFIEEAGLDIRPSGEEATARQPDGQSDYQLPKKLSFSQLDAFDRCPLKYKYQYIMNVPGIGSPGGMFGSLIHRLLKDFMEQQIQRSQQPSLFSDDKRQLDADYLVEQFTANFRPYGFMSTEHVEEYRQAGERMLRQFYEDWQKDAVIPLHLEQSFTVMVGPYVVGGIFDRVDPGPEEGTCEIIDYKTGRLRDKKQVDADKQLSIYALAARQSLGLEPTKLTLHFLDSGEKVSTERSEGHDAKTIAWVEKMVGQISVSDFPAKPSKMACACCDFRRVCEHAKVR